VTNSGAATCFITATANHYSPAPPQDYVVQAGETVDIPWPLAASAHWYDFTLTSDHDKRWTRRLAGHVETGLPSTSDPAYGQGGAGQERVFGNGFE
jgi:phospholipase C